MTMSIDPLTEALDYLAQARARDAMDEESAEVCRMGHSPFNDDSVTANAEDILNAD